MSPAIIVPAFSRPLALERLLTSLNRAHLPEDAHLVLSLDGGASREVVDCARRFEFQAGTVEVIERDRNIGLREHILWCGDQTERYGAVIVLEDDLLVDPWFFEYAVRALAAHADAAEIAGIGLYSPRFNEYANLPFEPLQNGRAAYRMQVPCSSGQAWTRSQWRGFRNWYDAAAADIVDSRADIPRLAKNWPDSSWKKYFAAYLAASDRCFVYPYLSYTTNCSDAGGAHVTAGSDLFQVAMADPDRQFSNPDFPGDRESAVTYDTFMEPRLEIRWESLPVPEGSVAVDLYGTKPVSLLRESDYCLTTRPVRDVVAGFPLRLRPMPLNVLVPEPDSAPGTVRLCRSGALYEREPVLGRLRSRYRLRRYFLTGPVSGLNLLLLGLATLFRRLFEPSR